MRKLVTLAAALLAVLIGVFVVRSYFNEPGMSMGGMGGGPARLVGAPAASYPVPRLDGGADAIDRYRGKVVLANLWATWCAPCRSETPALEQLYERNRARGFVVLGINQGDSAKAAGDFARQFGLKYPILLDQDLLYGRAYESVGLPTSIVVDRTGHIIHGVDGEMTLAQMQQAIDSALRVQ